MCLLLAPRTLTSINPAFILQPSPAHSPLSSTIFNSKLQVTLSVTAVSGNSGVTECSNNRMSLFLHGSYEATPTMIATITNQQEKHLRCLRSWAP